jgi:hypothetical protein
MSFCFWPGSSFSKRQIYWSIKLTVLLPTPWSLYTTLLVPKVWSAHRHCSVSFNHSVGLQTAHGISIELYTWHVHRIKNIHTDGDFEKSHKDSTLRNFKSISVDFYCIKIWISYIFKYLSIYKAVHLQLLNDRRKEALSGPARPSATLNRSRDVWEPRSWRNSSVHLSK